MNSSPREKQNMIRAEFELTRTAFHTLVDSLSQHDLQKKSHNPGWTNGEILAHVTFGFIILNALLPMARLWGRLPKSTSKGFAGLLNAFTAPFNWFNAIGARLQARVFTYERIGAVYDWVHSSLMRQIASIADDEWGRGMYYPTRWDSNFSDFMTIENLFRYPILHFNFHVGQVAR